MGLGGYGPRQELGALQSAGLRLSPDLIVLALYIGNDITGLNQKSEVLGGNLYFTGAATPLHTLLRRSRFFLVVERATFDFVRRKNIRTQAQDINAVAEQVESPVPAPATRVPTPSWLYLLLQKNRLRVYARNPGPEVEELWRETQVVLSQFDRTCGRRACLDAPADSRRRAGGRGAAHGGSLAPAPGRARL